MADDVTDRAVAALEGVTEGPWRAVPAQGNREYAPHWGVAHDECTFPTVVKARSSYDGFGSGSTRADASFIAEARTLIPELLAEVERLRGALKRIKPNARYISECGEPAGDEIMEEIEAVLRGDQ